MKYDVRFHITFFPYRNRLCKFAREMCKSYPP